MRKILIIPWTLTALCMLAYLHICTFMEQSEDEL